MADIFLPYRGPREDEPGDAKERFVGVTTRNLLRHAFALSSVGSFLSVGISKATVIRQAKQLDIDTQLTRDTQHWKAVLTAESSRLDALIGRIAEHTALLQEAAQPRDGAIQLIFDDFVPREQADEEVDDSEEAASAVVESFFASAERSFSEARAALASIATKAETLASDLTVSVG